MRNSLHSEVPVHIYNGPKKAKVPDMKAKRVVLPLKVLAHQIITHKRAQETDFDFLQQIILNKGTSEYGGFNTSISREQGHIVKPATKAMYTPLIDMTPSDPSTMLTAMVEAQ